MKPGSSEFSLVWLQPKWPAMPILRSAESAHRQPRDSLLSLRSPHLCLFPAAFQPLQPCGLFLLAAAPGGHVLYSHIQFSASARLPIKSALVFYGVFFSARVPRLLAPGLCRCRPTTSLPRHPQAGFAVPIFLHPPRPTARSCLPPSAS